MKTDEQIEQDILAELEWGSFLNASEIDVSVKKGMVSLSGTVDAFVKKQLAVNIASRVAGVKEITDNIEVGPGYHPQISDSQITEGVLNVLKWNSALEGCNIKINVSKGCIVLNGHVNWKYQRNEAAQVVARLNGVRNVTNHIMVKPQSQPTDLLRRIRMAFHRSSTIDSSQVRVLLDGHKATLTGTVKSLAQKNDAENTVWLAPGIIKVYNYLEIEMSLVIDKI